MRVETRSEQAAKVSDESRIAQALGLGHATLNEIDMDDVMLSQEVMRTLGQVSGTILQRYVPHPSQLGVMMEDIMAAYHERAFWVENTNTLVLWLQVLGDDHYVQIPGHHWRMKPGCGGCN